MKFPVLSESMRIERLQPPTGKVQMVLDTDTYNEIDDQFAVTYALLSPEQMEVEAIYAAPFHNQRSDGPGDGMAKSYEEILRVLERLGVEARDDFVFRGSTTWLPGPDQPVESAAARDLVERAMADRDGPLYVVPIGAPTNVVSAILMEPRLIERIVVVWLGGQPHDWSSAAEFNLKQDVLSSQFLFNCGVPFVHVPCSNAAELLRTTVPEMERWVKGRSDIGDYLCQIFAAYRKDHYAWSKVIWDIAPIAWLIDAEWVSTDLVHSPILTDGLTYSHDQNRHFMREARRVNRDKVFRDMFDKIAGA